MNFKQEELLEDFLRQMNEKFPEVDFVDVTESWEDPETLWINVAVPDDEDMLLDLIEFAGDILMDMFAEYGYHMLIMPTTKKAA